MKRIFSFKPLSVDDNWWYPDTVTASVAIAGLASAYGSSCQQEPATFFDREKVYGEMATIRWLVNRKKID